MEQTKTSRAHKTASRTRASSTDGRTSGRGAHSKNAKNSRSFTASKRARVKRRLEVAGPKRLLIAAVVLAASGLLGAIMSSNYAQWLQYDAQANEKAQQLQALQTQHDAMKRRLAFSQLPKGREQSLIEHNYLKPGDRYLLFPHDDKKAVFSTATTSTRTKGATSQAPQTQAPQTFASDNADGSSLSRAGSSVSRWWNDVNRATGSTPNATPATAPNRTP